MRVTLAFLATLSLVLAGLASGRPAQAQGNGGLRTLFVEHGSRYRLARLPEDIRTLVRELRATPDFEHTGGNFLDDSETRFRFARFESPSRRRSFLLLSISGPMMCGTGGCNLSLYEQVGGRWANVVELGGTSVEALPDWFDDYPTLLLRDNQRPFNIIWWDGSHYSGICIPQIACGAEMQGVSMFPPPRQ